MNPKLVLPTPVLREHLDRHLPFWLSENGFSDPWNNWNSYPLAQPPDSDVDVYTGLPRYPWALTPERLEPNTIWVPTGASRAAVGLLLLHETTDANNVVTIDGPGFSRSFVIVRRYKLPDSNVVAALVSDNRFHERGIGIQPALSVFEREHKVLDWGTVINALPFPVRGLSGAYSAAPPPNYYAWTRHTPAGLYADAIAACLGRRIVYENDNYVALSLTESQRRLAAYRAIYEIQSKDSPAPFQLQISLPTSRDGRYNPSDRRAFIPTFFVGTRIARGLIYASQTAVYWNGELCNLPQISAVVAHIVTHITNWASEPGYHISLPPSAEWKPLGTDDAEWFVFTDNTWRRTVSSLPAYCWPVNFPIGYVTRVEFGWRLVHCKTQRVIYAKHLNEKYANKVVKVSFVGYPDSAQLKDECWVVAPGRCNDPPAQVDVEILAEYPNCAACFGCFKLTSCEDENKVFYSNTPKLAEYIDKVIRTKGLEGDEEKCYRVEVINPCPTQNLHKLSSIEEVPSCDECEACWEADNCWEDTDIFIRNNLVKMLGKTKEEILKEKPVLRISKPGHEGCWQVKRYQNPCSLAAEEWEIDEVLKSCSECACFRLVRCDNQAPLRVKRAVNLNGDPISLSDYLGQVIRAGLEGEEEVNEFHCWRVEREENEDPEQTKFYCEGAQNEIRIAEAYPACDACLWYKIERCDDPNITSWTYLDLPGILKVEPDRLVGAVFRSGAHCWKILDSAYEAPEAWEELEPLEVYETCDDCGGATCYLLSREDCRHPECDGYDSGETPTRIYSRATVLANRVGEFTRWRGFCWSITEIPPEECGEITEMESWDREFFATCEDCLRAGKSGGEYLWDKETYDQDSLGNYRRKIHRKLAIWRNGIRVGTCDAPPVYLPCACDGSFPTYRYAECDDTEPYNQVWRIQHDVPAIGEVVKIDDLCARLVDATEDEPDLMLSALTQYVDCDECYGSVAAYIITKCGHTDTSTLKKDNTNYAVDSAVRLPSGPNGAPECWAIGGVEVVPTVQWRQNQVISHHATCAECEQPTVNIYRLERCDDPSTTATLERTTDNWAVDEAVKLPSGQGGAEQCWRITALDQVAGGFDWARNQVISHHATCADCTGDMENMYEVWECNGAQQENIYVRAAVYVQNEPVFKHNGNCYELRNPAMRDPDGKTFWDNDYTHGLRYANCTDCVQTDWEMMYEVWECNGEQQENVYVRSTVYVSGGPVFKHNGVCYELRNEALRDPTDKTFWDTEYTNATKYANCTECIESDWEMMYEVWECGGQQQENIYVRSAVYVAGRNVLYYGGSCYELRNEALRDPTGKEFWDTTYSNSNYSDCDDCMNQP